MRHFVSLLSKTFVLFMLGTIGLALYAGFIHTPSWFTLYRLGIVCFWALVLSVLYDAMQYVWETPENKSCDTVVIQELETAEIGPELTEVAAQAPPQYTPKSFYYPYIIDQLRRKAEEQDLHPKQKAVMRCIYLKICDKLTADDLEYTVRGDELNVYWEAVCLEAGNDLIKKGFLHNGLELVTNNEWALTNDGFLYAATLTDALTPIEHLDLTTDTDSTQDTRPKPVDVHVDLLRWKLWTRAGNIYQPPIPVPVPTGVCKDTNTLFYGLDDLYPLALWYCLYGYHGVAPLDIHAQVERFIADSLSEGDQHRTPTGRRRIDKVIGSLRSKMLTRQYIQKESFQGSDVLTITERGFNYLIEKLSRLGNFKICT